MATRKMALLALSLISFFAAAGGCAAARGERTEADATDRATREPRPEAKAEEAKASCPLPSPWVDKGVPVDAPSCRRGEVEVRWDPRPQLRSELGQSTRRRGVVVVEPDKESFYWCWFEPGPRIGASCDTAFLPLRCGPPLVAESKPDGYYLRVDSRVARRVHHDAEQCRTSIWTFRNRGGASEGKAYDANGDGIPEMSYSIEQHPCGFPDAEGRGGGCNTSIYVSCDFDGDKTPDATCDTEGSGGAAPAAKGPQPCGEYWCTGDPRWTHGPVSSQH